MYLFIYFIVLLVYPRPFIAIFSK